MLPRTEGREQVDQGKDLMELRVLDKGPEEHQQKVDLLIRKVRLSTLMTLFLITLKT